MSYLRSKKLYRTDNDGTFWPGLIEIPEKIKSDKIDSTQKITKKKLFSDPRIFTGISLLLFVTLFFTSKTSAFILLILIAFIATKEWFDLFDYGIILPYPLLLYAALAPVLITFYYGFENFYVPFLIFPLGFIIYTGTFVSYGIYDKFGSSFLFLIWFGTGLASIGYLLSTFGNWFTFFSLISISLSDVAAYEYGKRYGKKKLAINISPNKTIEGFVMGLIVGVISMSIVLFVFFNIKFSVILLVSVFFIIFATLGDLFESKIKRSLDVKDSSHFLPGHGGVLDRIDSQLLSFPVLVLFLQFLDLI